MLGKRATTSLCSGCTARTVSMSARRTSWYTWRVRSSGIVRAALTLVACQTSLSTNSKSTVSNDLKSSSTSAVNRLSLRASSKREA
ncbi:hypothetical protein D3C78_1037680 [compost metagenome]